MTFSVYRRLPLLSDPSIRQFFFDSLARARIRHRFHVWAYVVMPEHVHVLLHPQDEQYRVSTILQAIKQPCARRALAYLRDSRSPLLDRLSGTSRWRFWQAGGGYDRNLFSPEAIHKAIEYLHGNPVRRGLVQTPTDWFWSSAGWYAGMQDVALRVDTCPVMRFG